MRHITLPLFGTTVLWISLFLCCLSQAFAREPYFVSFRTDNGLPHSNVYDIYEDRIGYMWLATENGLYRYDGRRFTAFRHPQQSTYGGTNIREDADGRIWYINFDGYIYYVEGDRLQHFTAHRPTFFVPFGLSKKHLFTVDDYGVNAYSLSNYERVFRFPMYTAVDNALLVNGAFFVTSRDTLYSFSDEGFKQYAVALDAIRFPRSISPTAKGIAIISRYGQWPRIIRYFPNLKSQDSLYVQSDYTAQGGMQEGDIFHFYSPSGLYSYNLENGTLEHRFSRFNVTKLHKDTMGNYWVGTIGDGVLFVPNWMSNFYSVLPLNPTRMVRTRNGYLIGTKRDGLWEMGNDFTLGKQLHPFSGSGDIQHLFSEPASGFYSAYAHRLIVGNLVERKWEVDGVAVKAIERLDPSYFAVAGSNFCGLFQFAADKKRATSVWNILFQQNQQANGSRFVPVVPQLRARAVAVVPGDTCFYCATNLGLIKVHPGGHEEVMRDGSPIHGVSMAWHRGMLWVLQARGTLLIRHQNNNWYELGRESPGEQAGIQFLKRDGSRLLVATREYLFISDTRSSSIGRYRIPLGAHLISDLLVDNERLLLVTDEGVLVHKLADLTNAKPLPRFYLHHIEVGKATYPVDGRVRLSASDNEVKVFFSLLDFNPTQSSNLYYSLQERDWIAADSRRGEIQFSSLSPGNYNLRFRIDTQVLPEVVEFSISPPLWQQPLVLAVSGLALIGIIYLFVRLRTVRFRRQLTWLEEKMTLEKSLSSSMLTSLRAQMNPHFFYNALNTIQAYIYTNDRRNASAYLSKFSRLTRLVLEMSDKEQVFLLEELEALRLYLELERMRFPTDLEVILKVNEAVESEFLTLPPMMIQPYVENAFKHGLMHREGVKRLSVTFSRVSDNLVVCIEDNGIGRAAAAKLYQNQAVGHHSFATNATQKRLALINRNRTKKVFVHLDDLKDESGEALGTRVTITIPIETV